MRILHLCKAAHVSIRRHRQIKGDANPYDPAWEPYFDERIGAKWQQHWLQRKKLIFLWKEQDGICPVCDQKITKESGWSLYHVLPRVYGGKDTTTNLLLLHPSCREQVHYQKVNVTKPGVSKRLEEA